jgi:cell division protein FtsZ
MVDTEFLEQSGVDLEQEKPFETEIKQDIVLNVDALLCPNESSVSEEQTEAKRDSVEATKNNAENDEVCFIADSQEKNAAESVTENSFENTAKNSSESVAESVVESAADTFSIGLAGAAPEVLLTPNIGVIGLGGAGGNAINNMIRAKLNGASFVAANTDAQALMVSLANERIQLGTSLTQGLGAGAQPEIGRQAAEESLDKLKEVFENLHLLFITAGMGGGTGTGAAPVVAKLAKEMGILTVGVVTKPFHFEGRRRMNTAENGIEELAKYVDTLIIVPNQNLFRIARPNTTFAEAFKLADDVLYQGVRSITDLMLTPGLINLDFADVRTVMSQMGRAMMGSGEAEGENRALNAAEKAIANPLLDDSSMKGARGVLINISGGTDLSLVEVDEAAERVREEVDPEANIIFGACCDENLAGKIRVSIVATGIGPVEGDKKQKSESSYKISSQTGSGISGISSSSSSLSSSIFGTSSSDRSVVREEKNTQREMPSFNLTPAKPREEKRSPFGFPAQDVKKDNLDKETEQSGISIISESMKDFSIFSPHRSDKSAFEEKSSAREAHETIITISDEDETKTAAPMQKTDAFSVASDTDNPTDMKKNRGVEVDSSKEEEPPLPEIFKSSVRAEFQSQATPESDEPMKIELPAEENRTKSEQTAQDVFIPSEPIIISKSLEVEDSLPEEAAVCLPETEQEKKQEPVSQKTKFSLLDLMGIGGKPSVKEPTPHIRHEEKEEEIPVISEEQLEIPAFFRRQS